jgi:dCTP deaminase
MMYSDSDILMALEAEDIEITPFDRKALQPASVDFTLAGSFKYFPVKYDPQMIDPALPPAMNSWTGDWVLDPGEFVLGATREYLKIGESVVGFVHGKSSLGRLGLAVHITAGYIDPGFAGYLTLELSNVGPHPIILRAGMPICQIAFAATDTPCLRPYKGKYTNQNTPEPVGARG